MTAKKPTLGARLRAARLEAGLSVRELARLAGMNHSYLVKLETDQKDNPAAEKLQRLSEVLEIDPSELLAYIGVTPSSILPPANVYFRRKYGMSARDAKDIAAIVDQFRNERKTKGGDDANDNQL